MLLSIGGFLGCLRIPLISGQSNADADAMSRLSGLQGKDQQHMSSDSIATVCNAIHAQRYLETLCMNTDIVDQDVDQPGTQLSGMTDRDWRRAQSEDRILSQWIHHLRCNRKPQRDEFCDSPFYSLLLNVANSLHVRRGVLHRDAIFDVQVRSQLVVPSILDGIHNRGGHPGRDRILSLLRDRFHWPDMSADVDQWVKGCRRCLCRKSATNQRAPLVNIKTTQRLELVSMGFLTLEPSRGNLQHRLVVTDHFQAYPTRSITAKTTADAFFNNFIIHYDMPHRIHSDQETRDKQKKDYDLRVRGATIEPGDRVLVKIMTFEGKHKLADRWKDEPYVVLQQPNPEIPVFVVQREGRDGRNRVYRRVNER